MAYVRDADTDEAEGRMKPTARQESGVMTTTASGDREKVRIQGRKLRGG